MTNRIHIPPEAVEAAARAVMLALIYYVEPDSRANDLTGEEHAAIATAAIRAMLAAWPGAHVLQYSHIGDADVLRLPLTEPRDDAV